MTVRRKLTSMLVFFVLQKHPASAGDARDAGLIPGSGRFPGEENGNSFQYSFLENPMDRAWWAIIVHGAAKRQTQLSTHIHTLPLFITYILL